jgi:hypothetical protein
VGSAIRAAAAKPAAQKSAMDPGRILPHFMVSSSPIAPLKSGTLILPAMSTPLLDRLEDFVGNLFLLFRQAYVERFEYRN